MFSSNKQNCRLQNMFQTFFLKRLVEGDCRHLLKTYVSCYCYTKDALSRETILHKAVRIKYGEEERRAITVASVFVLPCVLSIQGEKHTGQVIGEKARGKETTRKTKA
jgi:hypothetical protein